MDSRTFGYREFRSPRALGEGDESRANPLDIIKVKVRPVAEGKLGCFSWKGDTLLALAVLAVEIEMAVVVG